MININYFSPKNIKIEKKVIWRYSHLLYWIRNTKSSGIDFNKIKGYIEANNGSKFLTLLLVDENKAEIKRIKKYEIKFSILLN